MTHSYDDLKDQVASLEAQVETRIQQAVDRKILQKALYLTGCDTAKLDDIGLTELLDKEWPRQSEWDKLGFHQPVYRNTVYEFEPFREDKIHFAWLGYKPDAYNLPQGGQTVLVSRRTTQMLCYHDQSVEASGLLIRGSPDNQIFFEHTAWDNSIQRYAPGEWENMLDYMLVRQQREKEELTHKRKVVYPGFKLEAEIKQLKSDWGLEGP